jgi:hypothetical protein
MTTLMLAGFAALSVGAGVASAQSLTPGAGEAGYFGGRNKASVVHRDAQAVRPPAVQYGGSDHAAKPVFQPYNGNLTSGGL